MTSSSMSQLGICSRKEGLLAALGPVEGKRIIDIGCGQGEIAQYLATAGAVVIGYDPYIEGTSKIGSNTGSYELRRAPADALPEGDRSADIVLFIFSLHHVPQAMMGTALAEARRILAPGGILCVAEPVAEGPCQYIMEPYHDETKVRETALAALAEHLAPVFSQERILRFAEPRSYAGFDDYASEALRNTRYNGYAEADVLAFAVRQRFEAMSALHGTTFEQPVRINLYQ